MSNNLDDTDIRRQIIIDHYENPQNRIKNKTQIKDYKKSNSSSPSCIDNINAYVKVDKNIVIDIKFDGLGCAIATSSTDIMSQLIKNKTIDEANKIIAEYLSMIDGKKINKKKLSELVVFENVNKQMNRIRCAKVGIEAIQAAINKDK
ncbi:MAG: SUF system NifU family Fe-S cluster assembly protein [Mycoplasmataceae bacterium]|jgi:nitrogen fixation NifU-like protein|nr:SUF system NifU family Fe-S cluster assembly protein [Mycoplasmataceae bacterium]